MKSHVKTTFIISAVLSTFISGCGSQKSASSSFSDVNVMRTEFQDKWNAYVPEMASPGTKLSASIFSHFTQRQDVLVELLDSSSWYTGTRLTIEPGEQWNSITLELPTLVKDPASAYIAVKILPVDASWDKYLDQVILPIRWPYATPITKPLYFGGTLNAWSYPFRSPVGNHGSSTVEVGLAADTDPYWIGPFQGSYAIQSFADTYGIFKTNYGLNLESGEVYQTNTETNHNPISTTTVQYPDPKTKQELSPYLTILNKLIQAVHYNANFHQGTSWPQLMEAYNYLQSVSARLYGRYGETLGLAYPSDEKMRLITGTPTPIAINYGASRPRDVLVDLLVADQRVAGLRAPIEQGSGFIAPSLQIPDSIAPLTQATLSIKIVPSGQAWTSKTAEINVPVVVIGPNHFRWVFVQGIDVVHPETDVVVSGSYSGQKLMDIRADLIDANGNWLAGEQVTGKLSYPGNPNSYEFSVSIKAPGNLRLGEKVTLFTKLLPVGGDWTQAVDELANVLTVE